MGRQFWVLVAIFACGIVSSARAGVTVTSIDTQAQANAYAPDQQTYFADDDHPNVSPASASVSDNWSGTNIGGSETTWNMVASAQIVTTTTATPTNLNITGSGSFAYNISTTAGFVDPTTVMTLFGPEAAGDYQCYFTLDAPAAYTLNASLMGSSEVYFASFQTGLIFQKDQFAASTILASQSGTIPAGSYEIRGNASFGGPTPLGANTNIKESGSITNFLFSVQVPEPTFLAAILGLSVYIARRERPLC